uniref:G-protein coupled receptors family 1 profile domain-containing protein n=1 Tax=Spermophilus dauricus TaxID=99837 RepID=A0A8C9UTL7_SPEDA
CKVQSLLKPLQNSKFQVSEFILMGFPGIHSWQHWLSLPLALLYLSTIGANILILTTIYQDPSLKQPMYLFLGILSVVDMGLSTTIVPKILAIFWFDAKSAILMTMAFDLYVAICKPLHYATILSNNCIGVIGLVSLVRAIIFILPMPILLQHMPFHAYHVIPITYCEHMAVVKMVCMDTTVNRIYGLVVALLVARLDISAIASSYVLIIQAILRLSSKEAHHKAVNTCTTHICVMLISYTPSLFSFLTHRFGRGIPPHVHTILGNLYFLVPPMLNPIIYGVKPKEFRDKVTKYSCWRKEPITIAHRQKLV